MARMLAVIFVVFAGVFAGAPAGYASDPPVTVYPSGVTSDDQNAFAVMRGVDCDPFGDSGYLVDGENYGIPMMFWGPGAIAFQVTAINHAGDSQVEVHCGSNVYHATVHIGQGTGTRRVGMNLGYAATEPEQQGFINLLETTACAATGPSVVVDGTPASIRVSRPGEYQATVPPMSPGMHLVTITCGAGRIQAPYFVRTSSDTDLPSAGLFGSIPAPSDVVISVATVTVTVGVALLLVLLLGFPAEFVNKTIEENEARFTSRFRFPVLVKLKPWQWFGIFVVLSAILTTFVDPSSGFDESTIIVFIALLVAIPLTTLVYAGVRELFTRRATAESGVLHTIPRALLLAAVMTVISRIAGFSPGYVYGLVAGYVAVKERPLALARNGRTLIAGCAALFVVSFVAWLGLEPVHHAVDPGFFLRLLDAILSATFLMGVQTLVFGLIPIEFMDGKLLRDWNIRIWAAVYAPGLVLFVFLLMVNSADARDKGIASGVLPAMVLFVVFGLLSMGFWAFFRYVVRGGGEPPTVVMPAQPQSADTSPAPAASEGGTV